MSLLLAIEEAIKAYKLEEAKLNRSIQFLREILHSRTPQTEAESEEDKLAENAVADAGSSPGEKEDLELLERALEKALRVRALSEVSKQDAKPFATPKVTEDTPALTAASKEGRPTVKSSKKSASPHSEAHKKPSVSNISRPSAGRKTAQSKSVTQRPPVSAARPGHPQQTVLAGRESRDQIAALRSKSKAGRRGLPKHGGLSEPASVPVPPSRDRASSPGTDGSGTSGLHQQAGGRRLPEEITEWKYLRRKENRLWEKVMTSQSKPEPGRSRFMQRMRATFPIDWPSGSPDDARFKLRRLTDRGLSLVHACRTEEILAKPSSEMDVEPPGGKQAVSHSCPTLQRLRLEAAELRVFAEKVKREWKAWDRWRPEGGCLCPSEAACLSGDGTCSPLPLTITYRTEQELQQLERLRMRVMLLQQEIHLEQVLWDALSPQFSSTGPGPGCPSPSGLRDMYSLLGEGGERFAAIVKDSEQE